MTERPEWMDALQFQNACDMRELDRYREREPLVQELMRKVIDDTEYELLEDQHSVEQKVAAVRDFKVTE